ncbi:unnamed protein product [Mytilus coruscus]|uniref:Neurotransmitter-gated ion-channel ligand-binding domain-containing protein n=1 Tax=Mytilus coruscus TaxID=42192 RepID=A0A6J8CKJ8_MYTCO|nr:unnamed protein product [Mytilus coruscus]
MNVLLLLFVISLVHAASYSDEKRLKEYLLANYSRGVKPRNNLSESVTINVDLFLNSVIDFDVLTGIMTIAGSFFISWEDEQIATRWNDSEFSDMTLTQFNVHEVWVPKLYIRNMADETSIFQFSSTFDSESTYVTFFQNGTAMTMLVIVFHTTCTTDITYYPFDKHTCDLTVIPRNLFSSLILETSVNTVLNEYTIENSEWSVSSSVHQDLSGPVSNVNFVLFLTRKPYFLVLNLVFPSMIICTVNSLSFLIPVESGACQNDAEDKRNRTKRDMTDNECPDNDKDSSENLNNKRHYTTWRHVAMALDKILNIIATIVALLNFIVFCIIMIGLQNS